MDVGRVTFTPRYGGSGGMVIKVTLVGGRDLPIPDILKQLSLFKAKRNPKVNSILISDTTDKYDQEEVYRFVRILSEHGWIILSETNGDSYPQWINTVNYRIVHVTGPDWLQYAANEIHYHPGIGPLSEIPINPANTPILYLNTEKGMDPDAVFVYLNQSPLPWALLTPTTRRYELVIIPEEE